MGLKSGESPMKYYKTKAKNSPMKIAPALIAKLAPMALDAVSKGGNNNQEGGDNNQTEQEKQTQTRKRGLENWLSSRSSDKDN